MSNKNTHVLQVGEKVQHLRLGIGGTVLHIGRRCAGMVLIRHADRRIRSYPAEDLYVRDPQTDDWTMRCRVEVSE